MFSCVKFSSFGLNLPLYGNIFKQILQTEPITRLVYKINFSAGLPNPLDHLLMFWENECTELDLIYSTQNQKKDLHFL